MSDTTDQGAETSATPPSMPFERIGGEAVVRTLVDRFYDLMDLEPQYRELRAAHGSTLDDARDKLSGFCAAGWAGRRTTPAALATPCCAHGTCRFA